MQRNIARIRYISALARFWPMQFFAREESKPGTLGFGPGYCLMRVPEIHRSGIKKRGSGKGGVSERSRGHAWRQLSTKCEQES